MNIPKFKPTKWHLLFCNDCNRVLGTSDMMQPKCYYDNHTVSSIPNIPFLVSDMKFQELYFKGWAQLRSDSLNRTFAVSPSNLAKILKTTGIGANGDMSNRFWIYVKVGGSLSLKEIK